MALLTAALFAFLLALLPGPACAALDALPFVVAEPRLATTTVTAVARSPDGFLWVATPSGLTRYDGHEVVTFGAGEIGLADDAITAFASGERLYAGTRSGGLYAYDPARREFAQAVNAEAVGPGGVRAVAVDAYGAVWIATAARGVLRYSPLDRTTMAIGHEPTTRPTLSSGRTTALAADSRGRLFVGTADRGLNVIDTGVFAEAGEFVDAGAAAGAERSAAVRVHRHRIADESSIPSDRISALLVDAEDRLWVGSAAGHLGTFDADEATYESVSLAPEAGRGEFAARGPINALMEDRSGRIWVARDGGGVVRIGAGDGRAAAGASASIRALFEDRFGVVWAGGLGTGLWKHVPIAERFSNHLTDRGETGAPTRHLVWSFAEDAGGRILVGTDRSGVAVFSPSDGAARPTSRELPRLELPLHARVFDLHAGPRSVLAALGEAGAVELDAEGATVWRYAPRPPAEAVLSVQTDGLRRYLGTTAGSLIEVDEKGRLTRHRLGHPDRAAEAVTVVRAAVGGTLWIGTDVGSLYVYSPGSDHAQPRRLVDGPGRSSAIWDITPQPDGSAWVAAREAGARLYAPDGSLRLQIDAPVDMGARLVYGVTPDRRAEAGSATEAGGSLWLTTENGLFRIDARTGETSRYTGASGLASNEFSAGALMLASDGTIYAGGVNGFTRFDPTAIDPGARGAPVLVSSVFVPASPQAGWTGLVPAADAHDGIPLLRLPAGARAFSVTVASLDFTDPPSNRYEYRLVGRETFWTDAGTSRRISYTDLSPGEYRLYVRGTNSRGLPGLEATAIDVFVPPAVQRTWIAIALLAVILLGLAALIRSIR